MPEWTDDPDSEYIIRMKDRKDVVDLILHGCVYLSHNSSSKSWTLKKATQRAVNYSSFYKEGHKVLPTAKWLVLKADSSKKTCIIAKVKTPNGVVFGGRNGWNRGHYNFIIYNQSTNKFFNCSTWRATLDIMEVLTADEKNLPLFISRDMHPVARSLVVERLKT